MKAPNATLSLCFTLTITAGLTACTGETASTESPTPAGASESSEWEILFDGSSVDSWRAYQRPDFPSEGWHIEGDTLKTVPGGDVVDIITRNKYSDFELELEWKVAPGGNSGIFFGVTEDFPRVWHTGPEFQILDDGAHPDGRDPRTSAGALYALLEPRGKSLEPVGEFNQTRIVVRQAHVEHWLNGVKVIECSLEDPQLAELIANSKFKDHPRFAKERTGYIALQHHGEAVWYRNVRVRAIAATESGSKEDS